MVCSKCATITVGCRVTKLKKLCIFWEFGRDNSGLLKLGKFLDLKFVQFCCFYSRLSWFKATMTTMNMTGVKDKYLSSSIFILDLQEHIDFVWVKPTLTKSRANNICGGKRANKNNMKAPLLLIMNSSVWKVSCEKARDEKTKKISQRNPKSIAKK